MIIHPQVSLHRLVLSLSEALDCVHPKIADHQQRVAYLVLRLSQRLGMDKSKLFDGFLAAALHDIGLVRTEHKLKLLRLDALESILWHSEVGFRLLKDHPLFAGPAEIVRYHHEPWAGGRGAERDGRPIPLLSHVLVLADTVERSIDRDRFVLDQAEPIMDRITRGGADRFHPDVVRAFLEEAEAPAFWLDCVSRRIYERMLNEMDWPAITLDERGIEPIARLFARVVDAASRWTATHSAGVAAVAVALAERLQFSPRELGLMRTAGYLHDLGKLAVPTDVLEKASGLDDREWRLIRAHTYYTFHILDTVGGMPQISEWAAFHHERLDGRGYPFRHRAHDLALGSRIMAVADTFTAITEDRPYRAGMPRDKALSALQHVVENGGLDGNVVAVLAEHFDDVNAIRAREEKAYAEQQDVFADILPASP